MKAATILLLAIIAAGVGYLAFGEYQERQRAREFALAIQDPDRYAVEKWAERAGMDCDLFLDSATVRTASSILRPTEFTCVTSRDIWAVRDRPSEPDGTDLAPGSPPLASGEPSSETDLFKPAYTVCWSVASMVSSGIAAEEKQ